MSRLRRSASVLAALAIVVPTGCAGELYQDGAAVRIVAPAADEVVRLPLRIAWRGSEGPGVVSHAVLVDTTPPKPGQPLLSLVGKSDGCRRSAACPDAAWLQDHQIAVTTASEVVLARVYRGLTTRRTHDVHEVVIVPLDAAGRRIGEHAEVRSFAVDRSEDGT